MRLRSIQFLRGVAICLIVYAGAFVLTKEFGQPRQADFYYLGTIGNLGLDMLFIAAGFMAASMAEKYIGWTGGFQYLKQRFIRINILFYIASAVLWGSSMVKELAVNNHILFNQDAEIQNAIDTILIVPVTDVQFLYNPLLNLTWAVAFLWLSQFLYFVAMLFHKSKNMALVTGLILLLAGLYYVIKPTDLRLTFLFNPILLEFLMGLIIYKLSQRWQNNTVVGAYTLLGIGIAWYIGLIFFNKPSIGISYNILYGDLSLERCLYWGIPSGLVIAGCVILEKAGKLFMIWQSRFFRLLGSASYSIFLFHEVAFTFVNILYTKLGLFLPADMSIILNVLIAVVIGVLFFWWVERPLLKWLDGQSSNTMTSAISNQPRAI